MRPLVALVALLALAPDPSAAAPADGVRVQEVDLLADTGLSVNAAGPLLVRADPVRHRMVAANTLTSTITLVDTRSGEVRNLYTGHRALQHLKAEALAVQAASGTVYLAADHAFVVVEPDTGRLDAVPTDAQLEAVAVDEATGNAFGVGRASPDLAFWDARRHRLRRIPWLPPAPPLANENQTPPPPIRKVVALPAPEPGEPGAIVALDGLGARLFVLDARTGRVRTSRPVDLTPGGRWHLAGADPVRRTVYVVTETADRKVLQAARLGLEPGQDRVVDLPGYTEGVAMLYDPRTERIFVNYDNHPALHVVDFAKAGALTEVALPAYGNDAAVLDLARDRMVVASWAHGEIEVVDLSTLRFTHRVEDLGILPHMHAMALDPETGAVWFPRGATAVNGTFGASLTWVDPTTGASRDVRVGVAPVAVLDVPERRSTWVFDNEGRFAEVDATGATRWFDLGRRWPIRAFRGPDGRPWLHYGPHQSYWPVVYIWGARNGFLTFDLADPGAPSTVYDRRIPRQSLAMAEDARGTVWMAQNNWGKEEAFLVRLEDGIREWTPERRLVWGDTVERETTQRLLAVAADRLVLVRVGERDPDPSVVTVLDPVSSKAVARAEVGACATDLLVDGDAAWVAAFQDGAVWRVRIADGTAARMPAGPRPLALARLGKVVYVLDHQDRTVREAGGGRSWRLPVAGRPDALVAWGDRLVATAHAPHRFEVVELDPTSGAIRTLFAREGDYGDTDLGRGNAAFQMCGQFGDALPSPTVVHVSEDAPGTLWIADVPSGRAWAFDRP